MAADNQGSIGNNEPRGVFNPTSNLSQLMLVNLFNTLFQVEAENPVNDANPHISNIGKMVEV